MLFTNKVDESTESDPLTIRVTVRIVGWSVKTLIAADIAAIPLSSASSH